MLAQAYITEWGAGAPWPDPVQVEQDLILSRFLIEAANHGLLRKALAFRGGTCLQKFYNALDAAQLVLERLGIHLRNAPREGETVSVAD